MAEFRVRALAYTLPALLLAVGLTPAAPASADLAEWNQERVTAVSADLATAIGEVRKAVRKLPPPTVGRPGQRAYYELLDTLGGLESASKRMNRALNNGRGWDETFPTYRRLMQGVRDARELARRLELGEPVLRRVSKAGEALRRIRPYYEADPI